MPRYFLFTDEKSNKFWQIDTSDTSFTVTFGKVGTSGQSQTKTFDTSDQCHQQAEKLIREKTAKGYLESSNGQLIPGTNVAPKRPTSPRTADADKEAREVMLARYDELIRNTQINELLPFLQSVDTRHYETLRKHIKQAKRYWCDYTKLSDQQTIVGPREQWGIRGTRDQQKLVTLSGLGLLNHNELKGFGLLNGLLTGASYDQLILSILAWAKPKWLADFLLQQGQNSWSIIPYRRLRELESAGLVDYLPELFARSVSSFQNYLYNEHGDTTYQKHEKHIDFLSTDEQALTREIPLLFEYPTDIHQCSYSAPNPVTKRHDYVLLWPLIFSQLLAAEKLDRLWFVEKCLSVQTKDWNPNLRQFFRKQIETVNPSKTEWIKLQSDLFRLLAGQHPHVVSWAIGQLKTIYTEPDFRVDEFLEWAGSAMMRDDCKTALKTLLSVFERLLKTQPAHRSAITYLLVDVFTINDLALQTKVASMLVGYADPADDDFCARLQASAEQMLGNVANDLQGFLKNDTTTLSAENPVTYQYEPKSTPRLLPEFEVSLPDNWNDFMFLIGQFISSDDVIDMEILMNALIKLPADTPDDFREQLKPYQKTLLKTYFGSISKDVFRAYLLRWLANDEKGFANENVDDSIQTLKLHKNRFNHLRQKWTANSELPFLSLPTHAPHWIAPKVLIERLLLYKANNEPIELLDFAIAIARMPREETDEALALCDQLDTNLAALLRYCLGGSSTIHIPDSSLLKRLFSSDGTEVSTQKALWAVAARTFEPEGEFDEFAKASFSDLPNVVKPFVYEYSFKEKWNEWKNYNTKQLERSPSWWELSIQLPAINKPFLLTSQVFRALLYSNDLVYQKDWHWRFTYMHAVDVSFWYSLIPQNPEAFYTIMATYGCKTSDGTTPLPQAITQMLQPNFSFREMSMLVLACGLMTKKRETGILAAEVLIHHFNEETIDVSLLGDRLGWLLANKYAPIQRLVDALNLVKDVSPLHNKALLLTLEGLFAQFTSLAELPKNTKKLLEMYLDLLVKLGEMPASATLLLLEKWQTNASIKKLCQDILKRA
ncbi:hypothetical protein GCM10028807_42230 [Spirosoma daeguense]